MAQDDSKPFSTLSGGVTASSISGSGTSINKVGFYLEYNRIKPINPLLSYSFGLRVIQKGALKPPDHEIGDYTLYKLTLNYVHLPFYFSYNKNGFSYYAGLATGYLINHKEENENGSIRNQTEFKKYELSASVGVRFQLSQKITLNSQLEGSILPARPFVGGSFRLNRGQHNSSLILGLSFKI
ncbi:MAG: outer membrane beta-barrel protein [Bacteroidia bacterium]